MKIACWNVRGLNSLARQQEVRSLVQELNISLISLVEIKVRADNSPSISKNLLGGWKLLHNYIHHPSGRVWVLWNLEIIDVSLLWSSNQIIHLSVEIIENRCDLGLP